MVKSSLVVGYLQLTLIFSSFKLEVVFRLHLLLLADRGGALEHDGVGVLGHQVGVSDGHGDLQMDFVIRMSSGY